MSIALLRAEMFSTLEDLERLAQDLAKSIRDRDASLYAWVDQGRTLKERRDLAAHALAAIAYPSGEGPTHVLPGVLGASSATLQLAHAVNAAKLRFKAAVAALRDAAEGDGRKAVREVLIEANHKTLSLRQAYREIVVLDTTPERIGFTWMKAVRSVRAITRGAAEEYLCAIIKDEWRLANAIDAIHRLPVDAPLYMAREVKPHLRANITMAPGERRLVMAHSPIIFPLTPDQPPPLHGKPAHPRVTEENGTLETTLVHEGYAGQRLPRRDRIIASRPLIPGTPLFTSIKVMRERI